jgi:prepilin-type N-terminal cleavage/methylation domain-containing protein
MKIIKSFGFTLIELLVVISVIGILAALSLVSFSAAQKQARDTQRKSDIKQYQTALEGYANVNNEFYPSRTSTTLASTTLCTDLAMTNCPADPRYGTDSTYAYKYVSDGTGSGTKTAINYVLWSKLESSIYYWVVCSTGKSGTKAQSGWADPTNGTCPI